MNARRPDPMITMLRGSRRLEVRPVGAARQLFQRAPQSLVVHILDADLLPQRREVALLMPQLDPGDVGDPLELQDALGVDQQHAEVLHPFVELRVDEAFHRRAGGMRVGILCASKWRAMRVLASPPKVRRLFQAASWGEK